MGSSPSVLNSSANKAVVVESVAQSRTAVKRGTRASSTLEVVGAQPYDINISGQKDREDNDERSQDNRLYIDFEDMKADEVSLIFDTFVHDNGMCYSCIMQDGVRLYFDENRPHMGMIPFPEEWENQGTFFNDASQNKGPSAGRGSGHEDLHKARAHNVSANMMEDDRIGMFHHPTKGELTTYLFEERRTICKFFDEESGAWLHVPAQWECRLDFVRSKLAFVQAAIPGWKDQSGIVAMLRQCNYDADEVVSNYTALYGDDVKKASPANVTAELKTQGALDDTRKQLRETQERLEGSLRQVAELRQEKQCMEVKVHGLQSQVASAEVHCQQVESRLQAFLSNRPKTPAVTSVRKATIPSRLLVNSHGTTLRRTQGEARGLSLLGAQLSDGARRDLGELGRLIQSLASAVRRMAGLAAASAGSLDEARSLYRREALQRRLLHDQLTELRGNIRVFCRGRPGAPDGGVPGLEFSPSAGEVLVMQSEGKTTSFAFDQVFPPNATQEQVFADTLPLITSCVDGYNVCILAYGQTGSGKTHTMMGTSNAPGVNVRSVKELLNICKERHNVKYTLKISMLEIYNETVRDLLGKPGSGPLEVRGQARSVTVPGLTTTIVTSEEDIVRVMETAHKHRTVASTKMNIHSSRSHLLTTLSLEGLDVVSGSASHGSLILGDLAGSERISRTEATGQRLVEAAAINKSLTSLGQVFLALRNGSLHVPYRNSKLTHLLQPALGGNAKACVFVTVSADDANRGETLSTLQFGSSIRQVALGAAAQRVTPARTKP
uniref:Kinesin-like protein KIFC3 n=1 Tax=Petromyzon marinus TaxID=7757 RepID=A0AAJ7X8X8_PETMA|nr:kinesin-like protein KIFC3 [Petromyzon marinus]